MQANSQEPEFFSAQHTFSPSERGRKPSVPPVPRTIKAAMIAPLVAWLAHHAGIRLVGPDVGEKPQMNSALPALILHHPTAFYNRLASAGAIGLGESYQAGDWDTADLPMLLTKLLAHSDKLIPANMRRLSRHFRSRRPAAPENTIMGARRNISYHYDISNDVFGYFLGDTMIYSAALFEVDSEEKPVANVDLLSDAQVRKVDRLLDRTRVGPGTRLLEIGTGWGELAIRAAKRGATVRTVTISAEQLRFAQDRIRDAGVADRVVVELRDYRELNSDATLYDAIISVEMIEAIGEKYWPTYFSLLDRLLGPGGRVGLQVITMRHDLFLVARQKQSWVNKYMLPGFLLPSPQAMEASISRHSNLQLLEKQAFGPHFADTLQIWRHRFMEHGEDISLLGFDETFQRTWLFFFAVCESGFRAGHFDVHHYLLAPPK